MDFLSQIFWIGKVKQDTLVYLVFLLIIYYGIIYFWTTLFFLAFLTH